MADNLKMAVEGTQFSDRTVSIAWGIGREASEVVAVPPAERSSKLVEAIVAGAVLETDDDVTEVPEEQAPAYFKYHGYPTDGQVPVYVEENERYEPGTAAAAGLSEEAVQDLIDETVEDRFAAIEEVVAELYSRGILPSVIATWTARADLTTEEGIWSFANVTRQATGGPSNGPHLRDSNGSSAFREYLSITGITPGKTVRTTLKALSFSGGGTYLRAKVQGGTTNFGGDMLPTVSWTSMTLTSTVGANGLYAIEGQYTPGIADIVVEIL